jgi:ergothioneine biosynthesis protein EgtB
VDRSRDGVRVDASAEEEEGEEEVSLADRYRAVRARTEALASPLSAEDQQLQSMPDCSPTKWHRAHTTWFFEELVLGIESQWREIFNSYYEAIGPRHPRPRRGMLSRPSVAEIGEYRRAIDAKVIEAIDRVSPDLVELGLAHEEQHQELILTDILHAFSESPLAPAHGYDATPPRAPGAIEWRSVGGGMHAIGHTGNGFAFDNESPRHKVWLDDFQIAERLVTIAEVRAFIADGGYTTASLWLSDGWGQQLRAPMYWNGDRVFSHTGWRTPAPDEPACFLSFYEADAIARWLGARLPTEAEWEVARPTRSGAAWEWTRSAYEPYPGFVPGAGALGEYNGKFMVNQIVLRGGSYLTPPGHTRTTYRNFWPPGTRFQATGVRLARNP